MSKETHSPRSQSQGTTRIREALAQEIGAQRFAMWFGESTALEFDDKHLVVRAQGDFRAGWIERNFRSRIESIASTELGRAVSVQVTATLTPDAAPVSQSPTLPPSAPVRLHFMPRWKSLDHFIVGPCNKLAYAAACQLADHPEDSAPLLFLHGGCGVGKTHLLQGICRRFKASRPLAKVRHSTAEMFLNEFVTAIRAGSLDAMRNRVRKSDLLVLDDIQFLSGKNGTQTELLLTLDACLQSGVRIALASDAAPRAIKSFTESLTSRFLSGLVVQMDYPDAATQVALFHRFAAARGLALTPDAAQSLPGLPMGSAREIEGLVSRLAAQRLLERNEGPCAASHVEAAARHFAPASGPVRSSAIIDATCNFIGVSREDLLGRQRLRRQCFARGLAALAMRTAGDKSWPEIARELHLSSHSSAHASAGKVQRSIAEGACVELAHQGSRPVADVLANILREARLISASSRR